jgi:DNA-binding transcriptional MerR regulator
MGTTHPAPRELLTTAGVARVNDVVPDTVRGWRRSGQITPAVETPSGLALYTPEEAERVRIARQRKRAGDAA